MLKGQYFHFRFFFIFSVASSVAPCLEALRGPNKQSLPKNQSPSRIDILSSQFIGPDGSRVVAESHKNLVVHDPQNDIELTIAKRNPKFPALDKLAQSPLFDLRGRVKQYHQKSFDDLTKLLLQDTNCPYARNPRTCTEFILQHRVPRIAERLAPQLAVWHSYRDKNNQVVRCCSMVVKIKHENATVRGILSYSFDANGQNLCYHCFLNKHPKGKAQQLFQALAHGLE